MKDCAQKISEKEKRLSNLLKNNSIDEDTRLNEEEEIHVLLVLQDEDKAFLNVLYKEKSKDVPTKISIMFYIFLVDASFN
jgi:hypothetical protein